MLFNGLRLKAGRNSCKNLFMIISVAQTSMPAKEQVANPGTQPPAEGLCPTNAQAPVFLFLLWHLHVVNIPSIKDFWLNSWLAKNIVGFGIGSLADNVL